MQDIIYNLMNKDNIVATFHLIRQDNVTNCEQVNVYGKLPLDMKGINDWLRERYVIMKRNRADQLMSQLGLDTLIDRIEFTNCASLFDSFWVKRADSPLTWNDVSLYRNDFSEYLSRFTMGETVIPNNAKNKKHLSPEYHSEGSFDHCWIREKENIYMLKAGSHGFANTGREPFNEVYANQVEEALGYQDYVKYSLTTHLRRLAGTNELIETIVTKCAIMTNENVGLMGAAKLGIHSYEELINYCERISEEAKEKVIDMLVLDCLICNTDRHMNNVSLKINNDTLQVIGVSSIYDNNMAFAPYYMPDPDESLEDYTNKLITKTNMSFDELFLLCYERTSRQQELRGKLRTLAADFRFDYIPGYETVFPKSRVNELSAMVRRRAGGFLEQTRNLKRISEKEPSQEEAHFVSEKPGISCSKGKGR